jgi:dTMP kinase
MKPRSGRFIVLEGPDGAGKTTQLERLDAQLQQRGVKTRTVREPGGTISGEKIRAVLLNGKADHLTAVTETFLFQAARAQLVHEVIRPALARGEWVLTDRYWLSTLIYQGCAGGVDPAEIRRLSKLATGGLMPDRYVVLWVPLKEGLARRAHRAADRMESKGAAFARRVSQSYRRLALTSRGPLKLVDGRGTVESVAARVWNLVEPLLP